MKGTIFNRFITHVQHIANENMINNLELLCTLTTSLYPLMKIDNLTEYTDTNIFCSFKVKLSTQEEFPRAFNCTKKNGTNMKVIKGLQDYFIENRYPNRVIFSLLICTILMLMEYLDMNHWSIKNEAGKVIAVTSFYDHRTKMTKH